MQQLLIPAQKLDLIPLQANLIDYKELFVDAPQKGFCFSYEFFGDHGLFFRELIPPLRDPSFFVMVSRQRTTKDLSLDLSSFEGTFGYPYFLERNLDALYARFALVSSEKFLDHEGTYTFAKRDDDPDYFHFNQRPHPRSLDAATSLLVAPVTAIVKNIPTRSYLPFVFQKEGAPRDVAGMIAGMYGNSEQVASVRRNISQDAYRLLD